MRPLDYYLRALEEAGFTVEEVRARSIEARVDEWFEFLSAYHEAVLGWVGGSAKVDGSAARPPRRSPTGWRSSATPWTRSFGGRDAFRCCWTYINCVRP